MSATMVEQKVQNNEMKACQGNLTLVMNITQSNVLY